MTRDLAPRAWRAQPWKNGGGTTHEIVRWPDVEDYDVRVSVADVAASATFSQFPGYRRWSVLIESSLIVLATRRGLAGETGSIYRLSTAGDFIELDGEMVIDAPDLAGALRYRAMADGFTAQYPADNPTTALGCIPIGAELIDPIASDGIWMMVEPLPPGGHTLRFGGTFPPTANSTYFHLDITYHVTVLP